MNTRVLFSRVALASAIVGLAHLPFSVQAAPLVSIGDSADIYFNGYTSLEWTSNVFRDEVNEVDDVLWSLVPGFELNLGRGASNLDISVITRYEIRRYFEQDQLDTELFSARVQGLYRSSRLDLSGNLGYSESKSTTGDANVVGDLIEADNINGALNGEYRFSPKFSFGAGFRYSERQYKAPFDTRFADSETTTYPLDLFYELTPKVDVSVGYVYSSTDVKAINPGLTGTRFVSGYEQSSHFFNIGARGNLLPKLNGFFKVGYRTSDNEDRQVQLVGPPLGPLTTIEGRDNGMLDLDADLTWAATPKFTARLGLSRDFGVGGESESTQATTVNTTANYSINSYFSATGIARYTLREYDGGSNRDDNQYTLGARLSYVPNEFWSFSTGYTYSENDSSLPGLSFEDHTLDITASLRY